MRPNHSLLVQVVEVGDDSEAVDDGDGETELEVEGAESSQPNQPGVLQLVLLPADEVRREDVVVTVGAGAADDAAVEEVVEKSVVVESLHPNHPGDSQLVELEQEDEEDDDVVLALPELVLDSSKQPHQPGVLQVSVRVREYAVLELVLVVVLSVPLLSKNFQLKQSWHSTSASHFATSSYASSTSGMTLLMRCVPTLTRQPRSPTVS